MVVAECPKAINCFIYLIFPNGLANSRAAFLIDQTITGCSARSGFPD